MTAGKDSLDARRRRAIYRAWHRGTKEMDLLLGRYAAAVVTAMDEPELTSFEAFLALPDPDMERWITLAPGEAPPGAVGAFVLRLRQFHGLQD